MTASLADLLSAAGRWRDADPDPATRAVVDRIITRADLEELTELFDGRVTFGTAGLRAPMGPGPRRLNRQVARQTAAGIARVLLDDQPAARTAGLVLGHDARTGSEVFAADIATVVLAHGIPVHMIAEPTPTPLVAFALEYLAASAAIVVTASHNPARDNGIKVFWSDGAQICPPLDSIIAGAIMDVARDREVIPRTVPGAPMPPASVEKLDTTGADTPLVRSYLSAAATLVPGPPEQALPLAVTSLHGVGAELLDATLAHFGHGPVHHVESQRQPDATFPTVAFPNPEEAGALDLLLELARRTGSALALANDPDADRLGLAAPHPDGRWQVLTGDQTGAILAWRMLELTEGTPDRLLVTSVVSSRLLAAMARVEGVHFRETLTGFKWLSRPAMEHPGWTQLLAYEEALGFAVGPQTRDKDGITAALVAADAVCSLATLGRTPWDLLDDLARRHGSHVTQNGSIRMTGPGSGSRLDAILAALEAEPPTSLGHLEVTRRDRPAADVHRMWLTDDTRVVLRASGTEPKFKYYCEAIEPVLPAEDPDTARSRARERLGAVTTDLGVLLD